MTNPSAPRFDPEELIRQAPWVRKLALRLAGNEFLADDLTQDALAAALSRPPQRPVPARAWLAGAVRNLARQSRRSSGNTARRERRASVPESIPDTADVVEEAEAQRQVSNAVMELPDPYRKVVLLRFFRDRQPREIAAELGQPDATVRSHIRRGLEMLRRRLESQYGPDWRALCLAPLLAGAGLPESVALGSTQAGTAAAASASAGSAASGGAGSVLLAAKVSAAVVATVALGYAALGGLGEDRSGASLTDSASELMAQGPVVPGASAPPVAGAEKRSVERRPLADDGAGGAGARDLTSKGALSGLGYLKVDTWVQVLPANFSGRVVAPDGRTLPDGTVVHVYARSEEGHEKAFAEGAVAPDGAFGVDMNVSVEFHDGAGAEPAVPREWTLVARTPDGVVGRLEGIQAGAGERVAGLQILLPDVPLFRGEVVARGGAGRAVPGARVQLWTGVASPFSDDSEEWVVTADERGGFAFRLEPGRPVVALAAEAPGFAAVWLDPARLGEVREDGFVRLELPAGATVHGRVEDGLGRPVDEGTPVVWELAVAPEGPVAGEHARQEVRTGAEGRYRFEGLPEGEARLGVLRTEEASIDDWSVARAESLDGVEELFLAAGEERELDLRLQPLLEIHGRLAFEGQAPGERSRWSVCLIADDGRELGAAVVDESGGFVLKTESAEAGHLLARRNDGGFVLSGSLLSLNFVVDTSEKMATIDAQPFLNRSANVGASPDLRFGPDHSPGPVTTGERSGSLELQQDFTPPQRLMPGGDGSVRQKVFVRRAADREFGLAGLKDEIAAPALGVVVPVRDTRMRFIVDEEDWVAGAQATLRLAGSAKRDPWRRYFRGRETLALPFFGEFSPLVLRGLPPGEYRVEVVLPDGRQASHPLLLAPSQPLELDLGDVIRDAR